MPRRLLQIDFSCALIAGVVYFVFFDFLNETLGLPVWVARTQVIASFLYGAFGVFLFTTGRESWLGFVAKMNLVYASFCLGVAPILFWSEIYWGSILLFAEGLLIAGLAWVELTAQARWDSQHKQTGAKAPNSV